MNNELKPCPFCKSSNVVLDYYEISCPQELGTIVVCNDCGASAKSIEDWNTRPLEDALTAKHDRLKAALMKLRWHSDDRWYNQETLNIIDEALNHETD